MNVISVEKTEYMEYKLKCIGILTSGGDAPGMNAAIRAVTRAAIFNGISVKAIYRGYKGLITGEIKEFQTQNVSNIIQQGGTILKTARCDEFRTTEGRKQAYETLKKEETEPLPVPVCLLRSLIYRLLGCPAPSITTCLAPIRPLDMIQLSIPLWRQ